jgi:2,5-diketo-D-gluconate reductase A
MRAIADGVEMPLLGFGVFRIPAGLQTEEAVGSALELGYRHLDTAQAYGTEAGVGRALRASGPSREQVFVTTKFLPSAKDPVEAAKRSLESLGLERVDLYLIHWPEGGPTWAWPGMQAALGGGLTRSVGVSNFNREELAAVIAAADVTPAVNQISLSPFKYRRALLEACEAHGVVPEAYGSLTHGEELSDPVVGEIAQRLGRTPAQVLLRWGLERRIPVIPKSVRRERMAENAQVFDFSLADRDLAALDGLDRTGGTGRAVERPWWTVRRRALSRAARLLEPLRR